jgi:hypothetical protein
MKRTRAAQVVSTLLTGVATDPPWPLCVVEEIHISGSFARGALDPHDIDVAVELTADQESGILESRAWTRSSRVALPTFCCVARGLRFQFRELDASRWPGS